jgi:hypothetical protein
MESKPLTHKERLKSVIDLAGEFNMPVKKVFDLYNGVNYIVYKINNERSLYNPDLEEKTFASVKRYLSRLN